MRILLPPPPALKLSLNVSCRNCVETAFFFRRAFLGPELRPNEIAIGAFAPKTTKQVQ